MLSKTLMLAVAASGLMAGAAFAQDYNNSTSTTSDQSSATSPNTVNPAPNSSWSAAPVGSQTDVSATTIDPSSGASFTTTLTTNGPVPDTPQNRRRYGGPESHAGRVTRPIGN